MEFLGPVLLCCLFVVVIVGLYRRKHRRTCNIHFITYGDERFEHSRKELSSQAQNTGWFDSVRVYTPDDIPSELREKYADILATERGGGYWVWKPLIIQDALSTMKEGDILVYADAGCRLNSKARKRFDEYIDMLQAQQEVDVLSFQLEEVHVEDRWTTEAIFRHFGVPPGGPERTSRQILGGIRIFRNGPHVRRWLKRVLGALETDRWLFSDKYNDDGNAPDFADNRHDQSIMSLADKLEGSLVLDDETYPPGQEQFPIWASRIKH